MPTLLEQARQHRRASRLVGRRVRTSVRFARQVPPGAVERAYAAFIRGILERAHRAVLQRVVPLLKEATATSAEASLADSRADSAEKPLSELDVVRVGIGGVVSSELLAQQIREFGTRTERFQGSELQGQIRRAVGIESPILADTTIGPLLREWVAENVRLVKTIPAEYFSSLERTIAAGVNTGRRHEVIAKQVAERYGVSQRRAALIARDQVGKFYGQVQRARQKELGIKRYRWRTSNDERVRPEHVEREGKVFEWTDPPADGHPGYPINCRCTAEPVITDVLEQLEKEEQADREKLAQAQAGELPKEEKPAELELPKPVRPIPTGTAAGEIARELPALADVLGPSLHIDTQVNAQGDGHLALAKQLDKVPHQILSAARAEGVTIRIGPGMGHEVAKLSAMSPAELDAKARGSGETRTMREVGAYFSPQHNEVVVGSQMSGSDAVAVHELGHAIEHMAGLGSEYGRYPKWLDLKRAEISARAAAGEITFEQRMKEQAKADKLAGSQQKANAAFEKAHTEWVKKGAEQGLRRPWYFSRGWEYTDLPGRLHVQPNVEVKLGRSETFAEISAIYWGVSKDAAERRFSPKLVTAWEKSVHAATGVKAQPKAKGGKR